MMWYMALSWFYLYMAQGTSPWCSFETYANASRFSKMGKNPESRIKNQESNLRYFSYHQSVWDESVEKSLKGIGVWSMYWFRKTNNLTEEVKLSLFETTLKRLSVVTQTGGMFRQLSLTRSDLLLKCILTYQEVAWLGLIWFATLLCYYSAIPELTSLRRKQWNR
jgi:hypothetical protein